MAVVLRCTQGCERRLSDEEMLAHVRARGMLRRQADPDTALVQELFRELVAELACSECGRVGLELTDDWADDWPAQTLCEGCQAPIDAERLEIFPQTKRCPKCQAKHDAGEDVVAEVEYCRHCGGILTLAKRGGPGLAGYRMVCTDCKRSG